MSRTTHPDLLTPDDVAELLGVTRSTVTRWRRAGHLPTPIRIGSNYVRYRREDIEALLAKDAS